MADTEEAPVEAESPPMVEELFTPLLLLLLVKEEEFCWRRVLAAMERLTRAELALAERAAVSESESVLLPPLGLSNFCWLMLSLATFAKLASPAAVITGLGLLLLTMALEEVAIVGVVAVGVDTPVESVAAKIAAVVCGTTVVAFFCGEEEEAPVCCCACSGWELVGFIWGNTVLLMVVAAALLRGGMVAVTTPLGTGLFAVGRPC